MGESYRPATVSISDPPRFLRGDDLRDVDRRVRVGYGINGLRFNPGWVVENKTKTLLVAGRLDADRKIA